MKESNSRVEGTFFGSLQQASINSNPGGTRLTAAAATVAAVFRVVHPVSTERISGPQNRFRKDKRRTFSTQARTCDQFDPSNVLTNRIVVLFAGVLLQSFG